MALGKLKPPPGAKEMLEAVEEELRLVEQAIRLESVAATEVMTAIGKYMQASGGKRLRPMLVLLASKLMGSDGESAIRLGAVVEMVHMATLVHDDVIDRAETRRGRPAVNVKWGNHVAVLAGDWLYMQAFQMALRERNFRILDVLSDVTQRMVEGELLQLERLGSSAVTESEYMDLVDRKTAGLFAASARMGALVAGADEDAEERLGAYAWNVGMAFQLADDVLDFTARAAVLGKPVGNDLVEGKVTLPVIYALEAATAEERRQVETVLKDRSYRRVPFAGIQKLLERHGSIERTHQRAQRFTDAARDLMAGFPDSPYQRALLWLTGLVTDRRY